MTRSKLSLLLLLLAITSFVDAQEVIFENDQPRPTPLTRPAMKAMLEQVKQRVPRIPLPELCEEDRVVLGLSVDSYEQRLKYHFLGETPESRNWAREPDSEMSLPYDFKVQIFWIVSRVNNCQYCIGHQETKLLAAGQTEERIAMLDCDWSAFPESHQAAFAFAKTLTYAPAEIPKSQFDALRQHFSEKQMLEMVVSIAFNNSINRWKEAMAVPQSQHEGGYSRAISGLSASEASAFAGLPFGSYLTPTPQAFSGVPSVVTLDRQSTAGMPAHSDTTRRVSFNDDSALSDIMTRAATRQPRLPMLSEAETRERLSEVTEGMEKIPLWMRTLAVFPQEGLQRAKAVIASSKFSALSPIQRARLSWVVARQDHAAYIMDLAKLEMIDLGVWEQESQLLVGDWSGYEEGDRVLLEVARDLAYSPVVLTDQKVAEAVERCGAATVVQAVAHIVAQTALVRITEAAQLPLESTR